MQERIMMPFLGQQMVAFDVTVTHPSYHSMIEFTIGPRTYTFEVKQGWSGRGLYQYTTHVIEWFHPRGDFGTIDEDGKPDVKPYQRMNAVRQGVRDILRNVEQVFQTHGRCLVDYAIHYRETHSGWNDYGEFIQNKAAHLIVHCNLLAPGVVWPTVPLLRAPPENLDPGQPTLPAMLAVQPAAQQAAQGAVVQHTAEVGQMEQ